MSTARNGSTRTWRTKRARVLAASTICHLCGHDQADAVDHVIPVAAGGSDYEQNLRPVHHQPCPHCGLTCNMIKGARTIAPIVRRSGSLSSPQGE